jgi:CheY-like chemotaxis protein
VPLTGKRLLIVQGDPELARLVGAAAERLGARVSLCGSGDEALAALQVWPADAAVLDLPLADGDPGELLAVLRRDGIPAVALSGSRGGAPDPEEARRLGARVLLAKPCPVEDVMEALGSALAEAAAGAGGVLEDADLDLRDFDSLVFSQARPALDELVPAPRRSELEGLALPLPEVGGPRAAPPDRRPVLPAGELAGTPLPRLLSLLFAGRATGALVLQRGPARRLLLLEAGAPVFAASNAPRGAEDRTGAPAGEVAEIAWSAFEWREGTYRMALGPLRARERAQPVLSPGDLVLEGMRRASTLPLLRRELPAETALARAPAPAFDVAGLSILPREADLLACADGTKSVADLLALSGLEERAALAFLQACRHMGILDEVERALASTRRIGFL